MHFVDELIEYFPDAKVILTTRDIDSWQTSVERSIFAIVKIRILPWMAAIDPVIHLAICGRTISLIPL